MLRTKEEEMWNIIFKTARLMGVLSGENKKDINLQKSEL
jgi:hypothetical protein